MQREIASRAEREYSEKEVEESGSKKEQTTCPVLRYPPHTPPPPLPPVPRTRPSGLRRSGHLR